MNIAIVGYGSQGVSALEYFQNQGHDITICDRNENLTIPQGIQAQLGENYLENLDAFDLVVRSPSIHPRDLKNIDPQKITSNTNEFFKACPTKNIIGVTGTKGKGTTSSLIARMLKTAGYTVHLGGNIGIPPLEMLKKHIQPDDWVILELANFQTIDLQYSPTIAVCLMVVPEHLDWHANYEEYKDAKKQLFRHQSPADTAIFYTDSLASIEIAAVSQGKKIAYMSNEGAYVENDQVVIDGKSICEVESVKLLGKHNLQNICAAVTAVWQITQDTDALHSVITSFTGLEHRLEFVRELHGVAYYNDSFGTTPETAIVAFEAFSRPKVGIVGGSDKGVPFDRLAQTIATSNTKALIAIGDTGPVIAQLVRERNKDIHIIEGLVNIQDMVTTAKELSAPGDVVLLSTGSASFGLFKDYKDRGEQFKQAVQALA